MNLYKVELIDDEGEVGFKMLLEGESREQIEELCSLGNIMFLTFHINDMIEGKAEKEKIKILEEFDSYFLLELINEEGIGKKFFNQIKKHIKDFKIIITEDIDVNDLVSDLEYNE